MAIEAELRAYVDETLLVGAARPYGDDDSLLQLGILDSLGMLGLVSYVEERFGVAVEAEDVVPDNFESVRKLATYIRARQGRS
jgi:acyl carrier protein